MKHFSNFMTQTSALTLAVIVFSFGLGAQKPVTDYERYQYANVYASYFGASGGEYNSYIAIDNAGNVILAAHTTSQTGFPLVSASQPSYGGGFSDAFVAKFNPELTTLIFSTYLGGNDYDEIKEVSVDSTGNIYVTGLTFSTNFPVTTGAYDTVFDGGEDAFFTKLNPSGQLIYSTYLGGNGEEVGFCILAADSATVYIAGETGSTNFPLQFPIQSTNGGGIDLFLTKLNIESNDLLFSTYYGGNGDDTPNDMVLDQSKNVYVCGRTKSSDFPVTNSIDTSYGGNDDGFIVKLSEEHEVGYSTYIGGSESDGIGGFDINGLNEICFVGSSGSAGLPCSENAFFTSKNAGNDAIFGKIDSAGDSLLYFSYFGGNGNDNAFMGRIRIMENGNIAITGTTNSGNFPLTHNVHDSILQGLEIFLSVLNIAEKQISYSTFLGGSGDEEANDLELKNDSTVLISGCSASSNFPTTPDAYMKNFQGGDYDAVFARFTLSNNASIGELPDQFRLFQNYPNPFNPSTMISYQIPMSGNVKLTIYNLLGQKIKTLVDDFQNVGEHSLVWDATDDNNNPVSSGVYFYLLETGGNNIQKKMVLLK
jgi:hypothetical protein